MNHQQELDPRFALAAGSVQGREHRRTGRNNQDAYAIDATTWVAVVADGCSGGAHSEIGARLGARLVTESIGRQLATTPHLAAESLLAATRQEVLARLGFLMVEMGGLPVQTVRDHLLFTVVGAFMLRDEILVFSLGDGVFWINGSRQILHSADNTPTYLGYALIPDTLNDPTFSQAPFRIETRLPTSKLESLVLGTDGAVDLDRADPGLITRITTETRAWRNPRTIDRQLAKLNRERIRIDRQTCTVRKSPGLLPDDTTLILIRRD